MEDLIIVAARLKILSIQTWESPSAFTSIKKTLLLLELEVSSIFVRTWVAVYGRSTVPPQAAMRHNAITFVAAMEKQAMKYIDQTPDLETKIVLIRTLNSVAAGKSSLLNAALEDKNLSEIPQLRLQQKQLVTMEVIQLTTLWSTFRDEFENEKNMLEGALVEKAAEDLRRRISEHEAEKHLSKIVVSKSLVGKIDLLMGVVCFQMTKESNDT
ncbi:26S proteasome non-ATPase regulatory subunit 12 homolog B-like [Eucalyptus grandis]|uniref:26S proteasome non-ATPase regulatory subunit 12 homolog B-like n=1 Tax=Eucalyptus grandis TaxID=71139 RepID=UPI00192EAA04|nr:26S proteasome non-ATPase regulatory subunit 12 homolog B-like [Eucalyptus grandis]